MITVRQDHLAALPHAAENKRQVYLFDLPNPAAFAASLPAAFQAPTQRNPTAGLPANIWVGMTVVTGEDVRAAERLLDIRARIRWVSVGTLPWKAETELIDLLAAWRCSNCGQRGTGRRPKACPHAKSLCGDAKIEPQIHWLREDGKRFNECIGWSRRLEASARELGVTLWPSVPTVKELEL